MEFKEIFKDNNEYNEKSIIGFIAFFIMILTILTDIITGTLGYNLKVNEFVYNSFVWITLGSLGIAGIEKFSKKK